MLQGTVKLLYHRFTYYNVFTHKHNLVLIHSISAQAVVCFAKLHTSFKILSVKLFFQWGSCLSKRQNFAPCRKIQSVSFCFLMTDPWWVLLCFCLESSGDSSHDEDAASSVHNGTHSLQTGEPCASVSTMVRTHYKQEGPCERVHAPPQLSIQLQLLHTPHHRLQLGLQHPFTENRTLSTVNRRLSALWRRTTARQTATHAGAIPLSPGNPPHSKSVGSVSVPGKQMSVHCRRGTESAGLHLKPLPLNKSGMNCKRQQKTVSISSLLEKGT